jgi:hypothetical protein
MSLRPNPVLVLSSVQGGARLASADMTLSFDEGSPSRFGDSIGHYRVIPGSGLQAADRSWARSGDGAALFTGLAAQAPSAPPLLIEAAGGNALFSPNSHIGDFSLEFWLYPKNMENGEQIFSYTAISDHNSNYQRIQCAAGKNRLQWDFVNFFTSPDEKKHIDITLKGSAPVVPKTWSHHLIRFDARTGLLEYLVNGKTEAIEYAGSTGREGGEVYTPIAGAGGAFALGGRFSGLIDEFRICGNYAEQPVLQKYPSRGGRVETRAIDLGQGNSGILSIEAAGGRASIQNGRIMNRYGGSGNFSFSDDSAIQFFVRAADTPYRWAAEDWRPFIPGAELAASLRGRYVQIAADFYPSGDGETSPYLEEIRVIYRPDEPPLPPPALSAVSHDGAVELIWKSSPDLDTAGYLVYYGTARGEYFGESAILGISPINAGKRTSLRIEGLENGVLYYFAVAAYDRGNIPGSGDPLHAGEFSREVSVRPLREPASRP